MTDQVPTREIAGDQQRLVHGYARLYFFRLVLETRAISSDLFIVSRDSTSSDLSSRHELIISGSLTSDT